MKNRWGDENDWQGYPIPNHEDAGKQIIVWEISPTLTPHDADCIWIRDYYRALNYAGDVVEHVADSADEETLLKQAVSVSMRLQKTTVEEYNNLDDLSDY